MSKYDSDYDDIFSDMKPEKGATELMKTANIFLMSSVVTATILIAQAENIYKSSTLTPTQNKPTATSQSRDQWGALAIDSNQGPSWGWAINHPTVQTAEQRALNECGYGCRVVMTFRNQCGAFAADQEPGSTIYGWAKGGSGSGVRSQAIDNCRQRGGRSCTVRTWGCTDR